jgi:protein CpxP
MRAQRVAKLHDELKITPAQENAWNGFVASMKRPQHAGGQHGDRAAWAGLTRPAARREDDRTPEAAHRGDGTAPGALNSFYSVLSPDQKKVFDEKAARMQSHWDAMAGHGGWQHRGGDTARG